MSQGGFLSLRAALLAPERVRALVLIDTQAGPEDAERLPQYRQMQQTWLQVGPVDDLANVIADLIIGDPELNQVWIAKWRRLPQESMKAPGDCLFERDDITDRLGEIPCPAGRPVRSSRYHARAKANRERRVRGAKRALPRSEGRGNRMRRHRSRSLPAIHRALVCLAALAIIAGSLTDPAQARSRRHHHADRGNGGYQPPYAAIVVDANSGRVLHASNPDNLRHPASITKIMTLYLLF